MSAIRWIRRPVALVLAAVLAGCHSFEPLQTAPKVEEQARVRLNDVGAAMMAPILGPGVTGVRGRIVASDSASVRVAVVAVTDRDGLENAWLGENVTLPRQHIAGYDQRELSPFKSTLVALGILAGMVALAGAVSGGSDGILQAFGLPRGR